MKTKLTKRTVDSAHVNGADYRLFDSEIPGFHLRIKPSGVKSYGLRYRVDGRQRSITIGRHGVITPDQARTRARELLASLSSGADPSDERKTKRLAISLAEFWSIYLKRHAHPHKAPRSIIEDEGVWRLYINPALGNRKLIAITRAEISEMHASLSNKPITGNRVLSLLSKMMNLAIEWDLRVDNPCRGVRKYKEQPRNRYLSADERLRLTKALACELDQGGVVAIWLCILTGARKGEIIQARWDQFDLVSKLPMWQIPHEITKQRRVNRKPLSAKAVYILNGWKAKCPSSKAGWVVPGRDPELPRYDLKGPWKRVRKAAGLDDVRLHDLRHDFASMAVAEGWSLEIIGRYMGHSSIQTTQRYAHLQEDPLYAMAEQIGQNFE